MRSAPFFHLILSFLLIGCGAPKASNPSGGDLIATLPGPAEETYCSTTTTYSSPITISGSATYQARIASSSGLGGAGAARPIRYAEVMVKNSSGAVAQCAETDVNGDYSFQLPNDGGSYTVYVNSRAYNDELKVSVLDAPNSNVHYSLAGTFVANGTKSLVTMNAPATDSIIGGAFNILDQIAEANEYLRAQVSNCSGTYTGCTNVATSAPKVQAYWKKGVNPGTYLGSTDRLSFYLPGYARLFILGGLNGDTDNSDTDHFDNSIILHEYGHFLEDTLLSSNSPGGKHNGNKIIDPRLAWSEGFGNFFQAAVLNSPVYLDTFGNQDGNTGAYFNTNLETATTGRDIPTDVGEGNFREFSVTRMLWDALDNTPTETVHGSLDNVTGAFKDIWAALTKNTQGMNNSNLAFRNVGDFHLFQTWLQNNESGEDFSAIRTIEWHDADTTEYAQYVTTGTCTDYSLTPVDIIGDSGSFEDSDLFRNNDFYHLKISSSQSATITLEYEDTNGTGTEADVDLYVYNKSARYGVIADMVGYSEGEADGNATTSQTETVAASFPAGDYLINVKVYTGISPGTEFDYRIKLNGSTLCPSSLP